jgi:peroxiredoxin Q/BCP
MGGVAMAMPKEGDKAPEFTLESSGGKKVSLKDYRGKSRVVLYFYPKDDTPGCTVEACGFRDEYRQITDRGAVVLGVSPDDVKSHGKFIEKFNLPFLLLADPEKEASKAYGVWVKKSMYGKEYMGVARTTFVIGKDGRIEKVYEKVKPEAHSAEILEQLSRP